MKNTSKQPRRQIVLACRVDGQHVSIEELARELVRCGGIVAMPKKGGT